MKNEKGREHSWMWSLTRAVTRIISAEQRSKIVEWMQANGATTTIMPQPSLDEQSNSPDFWYVDGEIVLMHINRNPKTPGDFRFDRSVRLNRRLIKEGALSRKK